MRLPQLIAKSAAPEGDVAAAYAPVLRGMAGATAIYYLLITISHPFYERGSDLWILGGLSLVALAWAAGVWIWLRRAPAFTKAQLEIAACGVYALIFLNVYAYLAIHFEPPKLIYFVLLALVSGTTAPSLRVAVGSVALSMIGLLALGQRAEGDVISQFAFLGLAGAFAALGMAYLMRGAVMREVQARVASDGLAIRAEAASLAKSAFLATISHEIRTPLNGVLGMAQVMDRDELTDAQRERLHVVQDSAQSLLEIISDVLDISRIEAGKLEVRSADFCLNAFADTIRRLYGALATEKGLRFSVACKVTPPGLRHGDEARLRQIVSNLITNALKFTDRGEIRVEIQADAERIICSVRDSGVGIPIEDHASVFDRFVQADASATRSVGGAGLGLAICRELATLMGGDVVLSAPSGGGSCFTVTLPMPMAMLAAPSGSPVVAAPPPAVVVAPPTRASRLQRSARILVVDDNPTNRLVLQTLLEPLGVEVGLASDGREASEAWDIEAWDAILMDIHMPVMDGVDAARDIRAKEADCGRERTPIIAVTASVLSHEVERYLDAGMDDVIPKPVDAQALIQRLTAQLLGRGQQDQQPSAPVARFVGG